MDLSAAALWWIATGVLVAAEMATGTFYLLMLAAGTAAAALAAHLGIPSVGQFAVCAGLGGAGVIWCHLHQRRKPMEVATSDNRNLHLDIGSRVHVDAWRVDGTARVHHRGAAWEARSAGGLPALPGDHVISAVDGNQLVLAPAPAPAPH